MGAVDRWTVRSGGAVEAGGARQIEVELGERRQFEALHHNHLLHNRNGYISSDCVVEEIRDERRVVSEVDIGWKQSSSNAEIPDPKITHKRGSSLNADFQESKCAVISVAKHPPAVVARDLEE